MQDLKLQIKAIDIDEYNKITASERASERFKEIASTKKCCG